MKTKKIDPNNKYNKYNQALLNQIVQIQKNKQKKLTTQFPNTLVAQQQNKILSSQDKVDTEIVNNEVQDSQPEIKVKKPLNLLKIDEKHILFNDKGLKFLYEEIESISFNNSDDMANLNNFMKTIKTWHFLLASKVEFGFFLSKVRELGYKSAVKVNFYLKSYMTRLRKIYKKEETWDCVEEVKETMKVIEDAQKNKIKNRTQSTSIDNTDDDEKEKVNSGFGTQNSIFGNKKVDLKSEEVKDKKEIRIDIVNDNEDDDDMFVPNTNDEINNTENDEDEIVNQIDDDLNTF